MKFLVALVFVAALCGAAFADVEDEQRFRPCVRCPSPVAPRPSPGCVWKSKTCAKCGSWQCPDCSLVRCAQPTCAEGEYAMTQTGECCAKCVTDCRATLCALIATCPDGAPATIKPGQCCPTCGPDCRFVKCAAPPTCAANEYFLLNDGSCCSGKCVTDCRTVRCAQVLSCPDGSVATVPAGQCCAQCPAPAPAPAPIAAPAPASTFCGGIAALPCPSGQLCKLAGAFPDAGGVCVTQVCGTRGAGTCIDSEYCAWTSAANCGRSDAPGTCTPKSQICPAIYSPVCGCDGQTYGSACSASSFGVSVDYAGACGTNA